MASPVKTSRRSLAMERTGNWVFSQEIPSDVVVHVGGAKFCLHRFVMIAKSGLMRKLIMESPDPDVIELVGIPGGPETFEKAAKFCYGENFEITARNVVALRCAAEYLEMYEMYAGGNLVSRTEEFLVHAGLNTFSGAVTVLKSCEQFTPLADDLKIVHRCVEVASLKAYNESNFQTRGPVGWWMDELCILSVDFFGRFMASLKARGTKMQTLAAAVMTYTDRSLRELVRDHTGGGAAASVASAHRDTERSKRQKEVLEGIVTTMPVDKTAFPVTFLCCLLRAAVFLGCSPAARGGLERRISAVMEHVGVDDLLAISMGYDGERVIDHESVRRIVSGFVELDKQGNAAVRDRFVRDPAASPALQRVAKTVDAYLAEIASNVELAISKFTGLAVLIPKPARPYDDDLYHALDIYLKSHPELDEIEREKVCSVMDPLNLSYDARVHASQNKRLPVQVVLHALYYDQLKVRCDDKKISDATMVRHQIHVDVSLMKENEELRSELAKMKAFVSGIQHQKGGHGGSSTSSKSPSTKRHTFFSSMTKTLGKLNLFRAGSKDTTHIENATCAVAEGGAKPRRRRFSIS